jgi:hypothetical protein
VLRTKDCSVLGGSFRGPVRARGTGRRGRLFLAPSARRSEMPRSQGGAHRYRAARG